MAALPRIAKHLQRPAIQPISFKHIRSSSIFPTALLNDMFGMVNGGGKKCLGPRAELLIILNRSEEAHLSTCISLSEKYSLANYLNPADLMQGWVRVLRGEVETGVRQATEALEILKSFPSRRFHLPIRIGIAGLTKAAAGDIGGALALYDAADSTQRRPRANGGTNQNCFGWRPSADRPTQATYR